MSYLKQVVLEDLLQQKEVEKVHTIRKLSPEEIESRLKSMTKAARRSAEVATTANEWVWQRRNSPVLVQPKPPREQVGAEVGVGVSLGHLNKRRQRARVESVARDVLWVKQLAKARRDELDAMASETS